MNDSRLTDLDELIETVRNKTSQTYIIEAVNAYRGGAYRAAIVSTWIAVVYDIIAKLRELSEGGDQAASKEIEKVDNSLKGNISGMTTFEYGLLETVYKEPFEFLTRREWIDLERLKEDRHACAHPAFVEEDRLFQPTPEVVRTHIVHSILYLLQHGPVQGKFALEAIINELKQISGSTDVQSISERLSGRYFNTAKDVLIRNLTKVLVKELLGVDSEFKGREKRRTLVHTLVVIAKQFWNIYEATTQEQIHKSTSAESFKDNQLMTLFHLLKEERSTWSRLEKGLQRRIKDALKSTIEEATIEEVGLKVLVDYEAFDSINIPDPELEQLIKKAFDKIDQRIQESVIIQTVHPPHSMFVDKAVEIYTHTTNPYSAADIGEKLLYPLIPYFTPEHIQCLLHDGVQKNESILDAENILELLEILFDKSLTYFEETKPAWQKLISYLDSIEDIQNPVRYNKLREKLKKYKITSIYGDTNGTH